MNDEEVKLLTETLKNKDDYIKELKEEIIKQDERIDKCIDYLNGCIKLEKRHGNLKWKNKIRFIKEGLTTEYKTIQICRKIKAKLKENE